MLTFIIYHRDQTVSSFLFKRWWAHCLHIYIVWKDTGSLLWVSQNLSLTPCCNCSRVFRAKLGKAIYQTVQSYSPQQSSYIFSSLSEGDGRLMSYGGVRLDEEMRWGRGSTGASYRYNLLLYNITWCQHWGRRSLCKAQMTWSHWKLHRVELEMINWFEGITPNSAKKICNSWCQWFIVSFIRINLLIVLVKAFSTFKFVRQTENNTFTFVNYLQPVVAPFLPLITVQVLTLWPICWTVCHSCQGQHIDLWHFVKLGVHIQSIFIPNPSISDANSGQ